jgi:hypothetical protein
MLCLGYAEVNEKPKLSEELVPDFIIRTSTDVYLIAELESPRVHLFTRQRHLPESYELRAARAQVERYISFIRNNILYLRQKFPKISAENLRGLVVIGLNSNMSSEEKNRLKQLNYTLQGYEIRTYDELATVIANFLENLGVRYGPFG